MCKVYVDAKRDCEFDSQWTGDDTHHWHACTDQDCDEVKDKEAHTWDAGVVTKEATETEKGTKTYTCLVCNGSKAFYGCKKLTSITIKTTKLSTKNVGKDAFKKAGSSNYKKLKVKVPKKKFGAYKTMLKKRGLSTKAKVKK